MTKLEQMILAMDFDHIDSELPNGNCGLQTVHYGFENTKPHVFVKACQGVDLMVTVNIESPTACVPHSEMIHLMAELLHRMDKVGLQTNQEILSKHLPPEEN